METQDAIVDRGRQRSDPPSGTKNPIVDAVSLLAHTVRYAIGWVQGDPKVIGHAQVRRLPEDPDEREYEDMVHTHI